MSNVSQTGMALDKVKHYLTIMIIALLIPLILSFVVWIVGSAFASGGGLAPGITYGIYAINGAKYVNATGVSYLWINSATNGGLSSSPAFPTVMLSILNDLIVFISIIIAIFAGIELVTALGTYMTSSRY